MTIEQVKALISSEADGHYSDETHGITLAEALMEPQEIAVIARTIRDGNVADELETVWLVGRKHEPDGYTIVMQGDEQSFGLASPGFASDPLPVLVGCMAICHRHFSACSPRSACATPPPGMTYFYAPSVSELARNWCMTCVKKRSESLTGGEVTWETKAGAVLSAVDLSSPGLESIVTV